MDQPKDCPIAAMAVYLVQAIQEQGGYSASIKAIDGKTYVVSKSDYLDPGVTEASRFFLREKGKLHHLVMATLDEVVQWFVDLDKRYRYEHGTNNVRI